jgi:hypothetical protein
MDDEHDSTQLNHALVAGDWADVRVVEGTVKTIARGNAGRTVANSCAF